MADEGRIPRQHVWGIDSLAAAGHDVTVAPYQEPSNRRFLAKLSNQSKYALGQLDQELFAALSSADVHYAADQGSARALALLGRRPVVSVVHHEVRGGVFSEAVSRRHAGFVCLSEHVRSSLPRQIQSKSVVLPWGPELDSPLYRPVDESLGVVSAGKSNRDLPTLVQALAQAGDKAVVYDPACRISAQPSNVTLVRPGLSSGDPAAPGVYLATKVIGDIARSSIVAVPALRPNRLTGLTEINDALALGKPMIVTRSPFLPLDIEASGFGIFVEPGDVEGWVAALKRLRDSELRKEMGRRGREFAERSWNHSLWGEGLQKSMASV